MLDPRTPDTISSRDLRRSGRLRRPLALVAAVAALLTGLGIAVSLGHVSAAPRAVACPMTISRLGCPPCPWMGSRVAIACPPPCAWVKTGGSIVIRCPLPSPLPTVPPISMPPTPSGFPCLGRPGGPGTVWCPPCTRGRPCPY